MGRLISLAELAMRTGTCESTWRKRVAREEIPVVRIGRSIRIAEDVAERIIREGTHTKESAGQVAGADSRNDLKRHVKDLPIPEGER